MAAGGRVDNREGGCAFKESLMSTPGYKSKVNTSEGEIYSR